MGTVVIQDGAAIPEAIVRQQEADERAQQAEIAARKAALVAKPVDPPQPEPTPAAPSPAPAPTVTPTPSPAPVPAQGDVQTELLQMRRELAVERQRNQSLQGRIDALGPQTAEVVKELRTQNAMLLKRLEQPPAPAVPAYQMYLKPEEREVYAPGNELPPEARMARGEIEQATAQIRAENAALLARLDRLEQGTQAERQDHQTMMVMQEVEKMQPGAIDLNSDPVFIDWLKNRDPRSRTGASYEMRGVSALERGDAHAIAELMKEFLGQGLVTDPRIAAQIKPELTTVTPAVKPPVKETVTVLEATMFFQDKALGRCRNADGSPMSQAQVDEVEKRINSAIDEGRVVQG